MTINNPNLDTPGKRIKDARIKKEFNITQLAKLAGISRRSLQRYENDECKIPILAMILLAEQLGTTSQYL